MASLVNELLCLFPNSWNAIAWSSTLKKLALCRCARGRVSMSIIPAVTLNDRFRHCHHFGAAAQFTFPL